MDNVARPPTVGINICCVAVDRAEGPSDFLNQFGSLIGGGEVVSFETKMTVFVALHCDKLVSLGFGSAIDHFENIVITDDLGDPPWVSTTSGRLRRVYSG